jgi:hypothetical protein
MTRQEAVEEAARAVREHGGPDCLTDPHIPTRAIDRALQLGATHRDIELEIKRQRTAH